MHTTIVCVLLTAIGWQIVGYFANYSVIAQAESTAEGVVRDAGYEMKDYIGFVVDQPDAFGRCTVKLVSYAEAIDGSMCELTITLRRRWSLSRWTVINVDQRQLP